MAEGYNTCDLSSEFHSEWVDQIPLSRVKKNISRDFSDGVLMSEIIHHYFPKLIELHNYSATNSVQQKVYNWRTLNQKVFRRMGFLIKDRDITDIVTCQRGAIERVLLYVKDQFAVYEQRKLERKKQQTMDGGMVNVHNGGSLAGSKKTGSMKSYDSPSNSRTISGEMTQELNDLIAEKDQIIGHLTEKVQIYELKMQKLEQLLRLREGKIEALQHQMDQGLA